MYNVCAAYKNMRFFLLNFSQLVCGFEAFLRITCFGKFRLYFLRINKLSNTLKIISFFLLSMASDVCVRTYDFWCWTLSGYISKTESLFSRVYQYLISKYWCIYFGWWKIFRRFLTTSVRHLLSISLHRISKLSIKNKNPSKFASFSPSKYEKNLCMHVWKNIS